MADFEGRARAEAEKRWHPTIGDGVNQPPFGPSDYLDAGMASGFVLGALWAREQEPTDSEIEAAAIQLCSTGRYESIWKILSADERDDFRRDARRVLLAAKKATE